MPQGLRRLHYTPLDPKKDALTQHHMDIMNRGLQRRNVPPLERADNSTSTVLASTFDFPDGVRMLPTFWNGQQVAPQKAVRNAKKNWSQWPAFNSRDDAEAYYARMKEYWPK